jgi:MFS family permease
LNGFGGAAFFAPLLSNVGNWFSENKGTALGIVTAGQALGQGLVPYVASLLIAAYGWREAYFLLGVGSLGIALPLIPLLRTAPSMLAAWASDAKGAAPADEGRYPLPSWAVMLWIGSAAVFCCITMATPLVHLVALAQDKGIAPDRAARLLLALFVTGVFGRLAYGGLADRMGPLRSYMFASAWQTAMVFGFTMLDSLAWLSVYAALFALGYSGVMTSLIVCVRALTPLRQRGLAVGIVTLFGWIGMGLGGVQGGFFYDLTGNYTLAFGNAAVAGVVNLAILAALGLTLRRRESALVPAVAG